MKAGKTRFKSLTIRIIAILKLSRIELYRIGLKRALKSLVTS
nr:MAG TPA: hypothetical protein [Caudoviricetes sp.]DAW83135.1 MAG TPA: hypothetical protein [Caudoviricetes sp.]DAX43531.1 MAG TPA: hypothetical protein [Caudoviricetes sp.]